MESNSPSSANADASGVVPRWGPLRGLRFLRPGGPPGSPPERRPWLLPLVPLYLAGRAVHQALLRAASPPGPPPALPLVVVGALRAGGSGKTSVTLELARWAKSRGLRVGVLAYRLGPGPARARGGPDAATAASGEEGRADRPDQPDQPDLIDVGPESDWRETSEEAVMLRRLSEAPVFATRDRARAWRALAAGHPAGPFDLLLSDDGFQDPRLVGAFRILLLAPGARPRLHDLLPAGPYRETLRGRVRADLVIEGPCGEGTPPEAPAFHRRLILPPEVLPGRVWNVLCGLGDNRAFLRDLEALGVRPRASLLLPDHATPSGRILRDFARRNPAAGILCTRKDALKLPQEAMEDLRVRVVDQSIRLDPGVFAALDRLVATRP